MDEYDAPPTPTDAIEEALAHLVAARMLLAPVALLERRRDEQRERMARTRKGASPLREDAPQDTEAA